LLTALIVVNSTDCTTSIVDKLKELKAKPFTTLDNYAYLHNCLDKDLYKPLTVFFRMKQADDKSLEGNNPNIMYLGAPNSIPGFRKLIKMVPAALNLLRPDWNVIK
jgi:hypothetical protein